jgi:predicted TIM-barrel fold metal-dependent hydrolase
MMYAEETLVFSSDYPHWDFDDPQRALNGVEAGLRRKICIDNGRALFGDRLN